MKRLLAIVMVASVATPVQSQVIVSQTNVHFDVQGATPHSLMQAIQHHTGDGSLANTVGQLSVVYKIRRDGDACRLHDVRVKMDITVALPRWHDRKAAPVNLGTRFDRMVDALATHEEGHVRLFHEQANQIDMALQVLRYPCVGIDARARQLTSIYEDQYNERQQDYDRTAHVSEDPVHFTLY